MSNVGTLYSQLSPISCSDFTPSRATRASSNPFLQQHCPFSSDNLLQKRKKEGGPIISGSNHSEYPLQGRYIQLDFSSGKAPSETVEDFYSTIRKYNSCCDPSSTLEYQGTTFQEDEEYSKFSHSYPGTRITQLPANDSFDPLMDRPISFALAVGENPILFGDDVTESQTISSPPIPPKPTQTLYQNIIPPSSFSSPAAEGDHYYLLTGPKRSSSNMSDETADEPVYQFTVGTSGSISPTSPPSSRETSVRKQYHPPPPSSSPLLFSRSSKYCNKNASSMENLIERIDLCSPLPLNRVSNYNSSSTPNLLQITPKKVQDRANNDHPVLIISDSEESYGRFLISYLGSKDVDCYTNCINECAKKLIDPKSPGVADSITLDVTLQKVCILQPRSGAVLKCIAMSDVFTVGQCTKNKRIVGVVVWKCNSPTPLCHLFRCADQPLSNAVLESLNLAQQDVEHHLMKELSIHGGSDSPLLLSSSSAAELSACDALHKYPAVHVASVRAGRNQLVGNIIHRVISEYHPSQSKTISVWLSLAQVRFVQDMRDKKQVIYSQHETGLIQAIGVHHEDKRLIGYVIKEKSHPATAHVLCCYSKAEAAALVSFLRHACQLIYHKRGGDDPTIITDLETTSSSSSSKKGLISRLRSLKLQKSSSSTSGSHLNSPPSFQSYLSSQQIPNFMDVPLKRKNSVTVPNTASSFDFAEEDYAKFSVTYVGSANMTAPFIAESISNSLDKFTEGGVAAGMAAVAKNTVSMHISALGINLTDKKQKMFINRNYPQKQIVGHCVDPKDPSYFGFATFRPGFSNQVKVHVFRQSIEPTQQILDAMKFWLNLSTNCDNNQVD